MSRKKARQARTDRMKTAREVRVNDRNEMPITPPTRQQAQEAIHHLQHLMDEHGCPRTLSAIVGAVEIAMALQTVMHQETTPAEHAAGRKFLEKVMKLRVGTDPVRAFKAFAIMTIAVAGTVLDIEASLIDPNPNPNANRNDEKQPDASKPEAEPKHAAKDMVDTQTLTKAWVAKSKDPNATPEEREQAKKLVEDYGIGDTHLLQ